MTNLPRTRAIRHAVRALIVDEHDHVLLIHLNMPRGPVWLTPGGGINEGEERFVALRRELTEEVGRDDLEPGPHLWSRRIHYELNGVPWEQREQIYLVRTERFEPSAALMPSESERDWFVGFKWWSQAELAASEERFGPRDLAVRLLDLLRDGPPAVPIDISLIG